MFVAAVGTPSDGSFSWDELHAGTKEGWREEFDRILAVAQERGLVPPMRKLPEWCTPELVAEVERLRAAITDAVKTLEAEASSECMCLMVADDLTDALKGATDADQA